MAVPPYPPRLAVGKWTTGNVSSRLSSGRVTTPHLKIAADTISIRCLLIHAISNEAAAYCRAVGLEAAPAQPRTLMIKLTELQASL